MLPLLAPGGRIIQVSTGLTRYKFPGQAAYAAMKGGFEVVTRYLARELGARGITANTVAPGGIVTDIDGIIAALASGHPISSTTSTIAGSTRWS